MDILKQLQAVICPDELKLLRENIRLKQERNDLNNNVVDLVQERTKLMHDRDALYEAMSLKDQEIINRQTEMDVLRGELKWVDSMEAYWNSKYPTEVIKYTCRSVVGKTGMTFPIDVRFFFINPLCDELTAIIYKCTETSVDGKALFAQKWVTKNISYVGDTEQYKLIEYWAEPLETLKTKQGDCDDGAILMANLMLAAGVPYWRIRITVGYVEYNGGKGLHAYVTYLPDAEVSKPADQQNWVVCDWCYYAKTTPFAARPNYKNEPKYYTGEVKFSFNRNYAFAKKGTV